MAVQAAPLVGRGRELASLQKRLAAAVDGSPGMVVVAGDAGAGKTRLVGEVMTRAEADGWTVLSGACVELSDGAAVLAPVAEVLRQLARDRGDEAVVSLLDGPARWLAPLVPELAIEQDGPDEAPATQVLVSFHRLLRDVADECPVLLVLEDLHWADATTRDLLQHLAVRLYDERLVVVATVRTDDLDRRHPLRPVLAEVVRRPAVDRIDLGPLDDDDLVAHLAGLAGDDVRHEDLVAVVRRAGGNPFHAEELLAAAGDRLPPSLHDALRLRLDRLPVAAQQLLGEAAVLGATIDAELLTSVTTLDQAAVSAALRAALDDGVLVVEGAGYTFRHALLREVALDRLLPHERVGAHAAAASALEASPDRAVVGRAGAQGQAAHHWWEARDLPRCLVASVAAAEEADRVFASGVALRHLERAMELWDRVEAPEQNTGTTRLALLVAAADAAERAADPRAPELGLAVVREADAAGDAAVRAATVAKLVVTLINDGRHEDALRVTADERARHGDHERTAERSLALSSHAMANAWAGEMYAMPWDLDVVATEIDEALEIARECGDWFAEYRALAGVVQVHGVYLPGRFEEAVQQSEALARRPDAEASRSAAHLPAVISSDVCGDFAGAGQALQRWRDSETAAGSLPRRDRIFAAAVTTWIDFMFGRLETVSTNLERFDLRDVPMVVTALLLGPTGNWLRWTGHTTRALDRAEYVAATTPGDVLNCGLAAELAASRAAAGAPVDDVLGVVARTKPWSNTRTLVFEVARLTAAIAVAAGGRPVEDDRLARLDDLIEQCAAYVEWLRDDAPVHPWATACMQWTRAERAHLGGAPDPTLWDPVVAALDERGHIPYAAVTRLRRADARAAVDGGSSPACVQDLLAAWDVFTDLGLTALQDDAAALARRLRVALPDVTDGSDHGQDTSTALPDLTDREREVLALVADGWTNKRVGEHLFISPKTVSVHMSNVMRKLGVDSRTEAVAVAHRAGLLTET